MSLSIERHARPFPEGIGKANGLRRIGRGFLSLLLIPFFWLGRWFDGKAALLDVVEREPDGLTIILTGVQGRSLFEQQIALGLADAGVTGRIEIIDWTTGNLLRIFEHLRGRKLAANAAERVARRIEDFRQTNAAAPIRLVGYSGGAYVALQTLEALPPGAKVTQVALLAAAASPYLDIVPLAERTERGLTAFYSPFDVAVLGLVTAAVGTLDGRHCPAAGMVGFHPEGLVLPGETATTSPNVGQRFHEHRYRLRWLAQFHYGGHLGYANRVWACETLGEWLLKTCVSGDQASK